MRQIQTAARGTALVAALAGLALTVVVLGFDSEFATLRMITLVALPLGSLAVVIGTVVTGHPWATPMTLTGLVMCMALSAMATDSALSGNAGSPLATATCIVSLVGVVLTLVALASARE